MSHSSFFLTTPLYYVNARPHIGHAYTTILADFLKRFYLQQGNTVTFLTGTDEHGEKIARMAAVQNRTPQSLSDEVSADFESTWRKMGIDFDIFYRTTQSSHVAAVQYALNKLKNGGWIEFREYEGKYCVGCERFLTDTEITEKGLCPDHQTAPEARREGNYFFRMSQFQKQLVDHYRTQPDSIRPAHYREEILSFLKEPLPDLCISRPKERLTWGIEIPFDTKFVTYVWVDALLNYLAATGWPNAGWEKSWATATHLIGKDILKTHAIYWPALLLALEVPFFQQLQVNGYWLMDGSKMSKSLGNVVRPLEIEALCGKETLRFYFLAEMSYGNDSTFSLDSYIKSVNAHLANGYGNLVARVLTLCQKGLQKVRLESEMGAAEQALLETARQATKQWKEAVVELRYHQAIKVWNDLITQCDLFINAQKPWALAKELAMNPADETVRTRLENVLSACLRTIQTASVLIYPVLPAASRQVLQTLGFSHAETPTVALATDFGRSMQLSGEVPRLFPRVQKPVEPV